ncbi:MAG: SDR family oxidoreductase [Lachnotalea sp.]
MTVQKGYEDMINQMCKALPMQRGAQPEEVTKLVLFLASSDSSFCTGSEYIVDGGQLASV